MGPNGAKLRLETQSCGPSIAIDKQDAEQGAPANDRFALARLRKLPAAGAKGSKGRALVLTGSKRRLRWTPTEGRKGKDDGRTLVASRFGRGLGATYRAKNGSADGHRAEGQGNNGAFLRNNRHNSRQLADRLASLASQKSRLYVGGRA
uniref:Uncharacterized protein n=1 Tax=Trichuris muris TaxID=70415 RepID=A0A5S6QKM3_TRIMR